MSMELISRISLKPEMLNEFSYYAAYEDVPMSRTRKFFQLVWLLAPPSLLISCDISESPIEYRFSVNNVVINYTPGYIIRSV